jgi:hypothetical protein
METTKQAQFQAEYDNLLEELTAFQQAGMTGKIAEWEYKIKTLEVAQQYPRITFREMASEFGIQGLQESLETASQAKAQKRRENEEKAKKMCTELLQNKRMISESKLYSFIDARSWQFSNDPEMTQAIMELLIPKLSPTVANMLRTLLKVKETDEINKRIREGNRIAFIRVERVEDYTQNDNPPLAELVKLVQARVANIFETLYIAYPMIDTRKAIDPIFFGTLQNPSQRYDQLDGVRNNTITEERMDSVNIGDMYKIAQWI